MFQSNHLIGFGAGALFGPTTTIWSKTLDTNHTIAFGGSSRSIRNVALAASMTNAGTYQQIRVRFVAATGAEGFNVNNASVGIQSSAADTSATPVELKFSGASGFAISASQTITSDWLSFTFVAGTNTLIIVTDNGASCAFRYMSAGGDGDYYKDATASYNTASVSGFTTQAGNQMGIDLIEARTA